MKPILILILAIWCITISPTYSQGLPPDAILSIDWNDEGTQFAVGRWNGTVDIIDSSSQSILYSFQAVNLGPAARVNWSSGNLLAVGGDENIVRIWDLATRQLAFTTAPHDQIGIQVLEWSPDDQYLVSATAYGLQAIQVYDATGSRVWSLPEYYLYDVAWSPDSSKLIIAVSASIGLYNATTGELLGYFEGDQGELQEAEWNADGTQIASSGIYADVQVYDTVTMSETLFLGGHTDRVGSIDWHPSYAHILATASDDGTVRIWDSISGELLKIITVGERVLEAEWSPDGIHLAYGDAVGQLALADMTDILPTPTPTPTLTFTPSPP